MDKDINDDNDDGKEEVESGRNKEESEEWRKK